MLRHVEDRSKSAVEALLRVRKDAAERAAAEVRRAEGEASTAAADLAAARAEHDAHAAERAAFQAEALGSALRPAELAERTAYLSAIDGRLASASTRVGACARELERVELVCAERRRALAEEMAHERALEVRLEQWAREGARAAEKSREDDALDAHLARRS